MTNDILNCTIASLQREKSVQTCETKSLKKSATVPKMDRSRFGEILDLTSRLGKCLHENILKGKQGQKRKSSI